MQELISFDIFLREGQLAHPVLQVQEVSLVKKDWMVKTEDKDQEAHRVLQEALDSLETLVVKDPLELKDKKVYLENQVRFFTEILKISFEIFSKNDRNLSPVISPSFHTAEGATTSNEM